MQFDSFTFVVFFAVVLCVYNAMRDWSARKWFLLIASYVFYAAWNPLFLPLLIGSATLDYWVARRIHVAAGAARKRWIVLTLVVNLGVLGIFKYHAFLLDNLAAVFALVGVRYVPAPMD